MSRIGYFSFHQACEVHVVSAVGDSCPLADDPEMDLEVECVLHCDDPEDGVYGEDIRATIAGTNIELSQEAVELLGLSCRAGEVFMESGCVHPDPGSKFMDREGIIWTVVGSGMHHEEAHDYTLLERSSGPRGTLGDGKRRTVVETNQLCFPAMIEDGGEAVPLWRRVVEDDEPAKGTWRPMHTVYTGKPWAYKPEEACTLDTDGRGCFQRRGHDGPHDHEVSR